MAKATDGPSCAGLAWASLGFAFSPALFGSHPPTLEFFAPRATWGGLWINLLLRALSLALCALLLHLLDLLGTSLPPAANSEKKENGREAYRHRVRLVVFPTLLTKRSLSVAGLPLSLPLNAS